MKVITLDSNAFSKSCNELISKLDFIPGTILGILNGGGYIIKEIESNNLMKNNNFEFIKLQRKNSIKNNWLVNRLLKVVPYKVSNWLRVLESNRTRKLIKKLNLSELSKIKMVLKWDSDFKKNTQNILIIDDALDSGRTMYIVKNNLMALYPDAKIKIAVISWTLNNSIVEPDYYIYKDVLVRFPWSKDYKGKNFEEKSFSC